MKISNGYVNCKEMFGNEVFCLRNKIEVQDLTIGAKKYGGATKIDNKCYSNFQETTVLDIRYHNFIGILVPSTINVNEVCDNSQNVAKVVETLKYFGKDCRIIEAEGSWVAENGEVVVEMSNIVEFRVDMTENMEFWLSVANILAEETKNDMKQEAVSIFFNDSLVIV